MSSLVHLLGRTTSLYAAPSCRYGSRCLFLRRASTTSVEPTEPNDQQVASAPSAKVPSGGGEGPIGDAVKLLKLAQATSAALEQHAVRGTAGTFWDESTLRAIQGDVVQARQLITNALRRGERPVPISPSALNYELLVKEVEQLEPKALSLDATLEMFELSDTMRKSLRFLDQLPPEDTREEGSGKEFDRKAKRRENRLEKLLFAEEIDVDPAELEARKKKLEESNSIRTLLQGFTTAVLDAKRVVKVTAGGQMVKQRTLIAIGNRAGTVGYGVGKAESIQQAIQRACRDARRNLIHVDLYRNRTLYHRTMGKFVCSKVEVWPLGEGRGIRANPNFMAIFELLGVRDVGAKLHGPRSQINAVKALFKALGAHRSAEQVASTRGLAVADLDYRGGPRMYL